jgi:hypothetical protein
MHIVDAAPCSLMKKRIYFYALSSGTKGVYHMQSSCMIQEKKSNDMEASIYYKPFFLPKIICDKWSTYQMCHFENILLAPWNLVLGAP